jgi:hypothetical protein
VEKKLSKQELSAIAMREGAYAEIGKALTALEHARQYARTFSSARPCDGDCVNLNGALSMAYFALKELEYHPSFIPITNNFTESLRWL